MATVDPSAAERAEGRTLSGKVWLLLRTTGEGFVEDDAWSRAASITTSKVGATEKSVK